MLSLIDSHCHLDDLDYQKLHKNINDVITKANIQDVKYILNVSTTLNKFIKIKKQIHFFKNIFYSCGIHPLKIDENYNFTQFANLVSLQDKQMIAIGETGLDYFHTNKNNNLQQKVFRDHIRIACKSKKPIIIHTRKSKKDTLTILHEEQVSLCGGVLHCFTEDINTAKILLDMGLYISFSGIVTFNNAQDIRQAVRYVPLDRILIESDAPYLTPVPYRGKENQPAYLKNTAQYIANLKYINIEEFAKIIEQNFCKLFNLQKLKI